jgi:type IV pilus assembly protein PilA
LEGTVNRLGPLKQNASERGLTTIEVVVAVAVTALMLALAFSAVDTYFVRKQVAESLTLAQPLQHRVAHVFRSSGDPPGDASSQPTAEQIGGTYVDTIDIVDGRIDLRFGRAADGAIAGRVLSLTPFETADLEVVWVCGGAVPGVGLHPLGFSSGARQAVQAPTSIEPRYLPRACR